jgi:hypothetical protein
VGRCHEQEMVDDSGHERSRRLTESGATEQDSPGERSQKALVKRQSGPGPLTEVTTE